MRIKLPNRAHLGVVTLAILIVMCTLLILSAVFPFPEGQWNFLSIGTSEKVYANPDWLSGYDYRKQITIEAAAAPHLLENITYSSRTDPVGAHQGVVWDGTYWYTSSQHPSTGDAQVLNKFNASWELQVTRNVDGDLPEGATQVNGLSYYNGVLYVGCNNYPTTPKKGWILEYDPSDLTLDDTHEVEAQWCEGCDYYDGYFWVIYGGHDDNDVWTSAYNTSWVWQADYDLPSEQTGGAYEAGYQQIRWFEHGDSDYIICNMHGGTVEEKCDIYKWDGTEFLLAQRLSHPNANCEQGVYIDTSGQYLYWCERNYGADPDDDRVYKTSFTWSDESLTNYTMPLNVYKGSGSDSGNTVYLNNHCEDDFSDIAFTQDDEVTPLDFWIQPDSVVSGTSCIVSVEFDSIPEDTDSPDYANFYIYYDSDSPSESSDGAATFTFFDDFSGDLSKWDTTGAPAISSGIATMDNDDGIKSDDQFGTGIAIYARAKATEQDSSFLALADVYNCETPPVFSLYASDYYVDGEYTKIRPFSRNANGYEGPFDDYDSIDFRSDYYIYEIARATYWAKFYRHSGLLRTNGIRIPTADLSAMFYVWDSSVESTLYVDWVFVRPYIYPEPTWGAWGSEEAFTVEITNTPSSKDFGIVEVNGTGSTTINYFQVENTGTCTVDVVIYGTDATGGDDTWTLSDTATPGENQYGLKCGLDDDDDTFDIIVRKTATYNTLVADLAEDATQDWGLKIYMPTALSGYDNGQMTATITLVASEA